MAVYRICERHEYFVEADSAEDAILKSETVGSRLTFEDYTNIAEDYDHSSTWVERVGEPERYKNGSIADYDDDRLENGEA